MLSKPYIKTGNQILLFKRNIDSLIAGIVGVIIIYLFTKHSGIGVSPDSITYTAAARNLHLGNGLKEFTGDPMVDFPAFYPLFLSAIMFITGHDVITFAPVLNELLFGVVIYLCGCIIEQFIFPSKWYKWIILACIAVSSSLLEIYTMLWSETLFIVLSLLFFIGIKKYFKSNSISSLLIISAIASIAFVTRYAGIAFIGTGSILLLFNKDIKWVKKTIHIVLFGIIGISLATINLVRNYFATSTMTGPRQKGITPFSNNLNYYSDILWDWLSFFKENYKWAMLVAFIIVSAFLIIFLYRAIRGVHYHSYENITLVFFIVYSTAIVVSSTVSRYETINNRLLSPAFIPFILGITYFIPQWIAQTKNDKIKWVKIICCFIIAALFLSNQYAVDKLTYKDSKESGIGGYTEDIWKRSATVQFIKKDTSVFKPQNFVYSNANHAIYFLTGKIAETIPQIVHKVEVDSFYHETTVYIVWFNTDLNPNLLSMSQIAQRKQVIPIHLFADGAIYLCTNDSLLAKRYLDNNKLMQTNIEKSMPIKHLRRKVKLHH